MQAQERQLRIEEYLQKVEFASLDELSSHVEVSVSTVRRDLTLLESNGTVKRTHGGARIVIPRSDEFAFAARDTHQVEEKEAIGRACAALIQPGQTVLIDVGTTAFHVALHLESQKPQVITNSLPVAQCFGSLGSMVEVVVTGGVVYPRLGALLGPVAVETISKVHADVAVMSASGITLEGLSNSHGLLIEIQKAMLKATKRVIFCLDYTKFGRQSLSALCGLDAIHTLVTDSKAPADMIAALRSQEIEVIQAVA